MSSIAWLENYLLNYKGSVIIVAHDRYFLDKIVTKVVELDNGKATIYLGNYSAYSEKRAQMRAIQMKAYLNQQQEIKHQEEVIEKLKSFNREKSIKRAESREKMLNKIEVLEKPTEINDAMDIRLEPNILSGNDVLTVRDLEKSFGPQHLFSHVDFDVKRGERAYHRRQRHRKDYDPENDQRPCDAGSRGDHPGLPGPHRLLRPGPSGAPYG